MAWIYLLIAGMTEIVWAIGLKEAHGFHNPYSIYSNDCFSS